MKYRVFFFSKKINKTEKPLVKKKSEIIQSCLTLCDPMDCSLPGFSVHGIFQARVLEWVAIAFSRRSSQPRDESRSPTIQADTLLSETPGKSKKRKKEEKKKRTQMKYYMKEEYYSNMLTNLIKEMEKFLETYIISRISQLEIDNLKKKLLALNQ